MVHDNPETVLSRKPVGQPCDPGSPGGARGILHSVVRRLTARRELLLLPPHGRTNMEPERLDTLENHSYRPSLALSGPATAKDDVPMHRSRCCHRCVRHQYHGNASLPGRDHFAR